MDRKEFYAHLKEFIDHKLDLHAKIVKERGEEEADFQILEASAINAMECQELEGAPFPLKADGMFNAIGFMAACLYLDLLRQGVVKMVVTHEKLPDDFGKPN